MALTAENVRVAVTGAVFYAPAGTTVPTSVSEELDPGFVDVGYISDDGLTTSTPTETSDIRAWQNGDIVRRVQTSHDFTVQFAMLETSAATLALYWNDYTAGAGADSAVVEVTGAQPYRGAFVINVVDGDNLMRIVIPDGQITERGDITYLNEAGIMYDVTITAFPDGSGVKAYIYAESDAAS